MHFLVSKSILDSLKGVFNVFRRKPSLYAPAKWSKFIVMQSSFAHQSITFKIDNALHFSHSQKCRVNYLELQIEHSKFLQSAIMFLWALQLFYMPTENNVPVISCQKQGFVLLILCHVSFKIASKVYPPVGEWLLLWKYLYIWGNLCCVNMTPRWFYFASEWNIPCQWSKNVA